MATENFETIYRKLPDYVRNGEQNVFDEKSILWKELFARRHDVINDKAEEKLQNFLSPNSSQAAGTAAWDMEGRSDVLAYVAEKIDVDLFERFHMPVTGAPLTFDFIGKTVSMPFLWRFLTFQRTQESLDYLANPQELNIVEIGAGYGCVANLWIQSGKVRSYTIVDLPENLVNAAYYLSENHPDWEVNLIESELVEPNEQSINLLVPGHIHNISFTGFNLAINTDSLGEMPKVTAQRYVEWVFNHLGMGSLFFSKNGHRRGYDNFGVPLVSQYGYERFSLREFGPNTYCTSAFDDFSHVAIMQKSDEGLNANCLRIMDILANLYATGLSADIVPISKRFVKNNLEREDLEFLDSCEEFFRGKEIKKIPEAYAYLCSYLLALRDGSRPVKNIKNLQLYLEKGKSDIAIVYCVMFQKFFRNTWAFEKANIPAVKHYSVEFVRFDQNPWLLRRIKYQLRFDVIKKKIKPYSQTVRSPLLLAKNLFLNYREKKRISLYR